MPALDGLRGVAVLGVVLYHAGVPVLPGGFLGVDLFFVLSGFLITSLLLVEWSSRGRIDLRTFWMRRARRLLPALVLVLLAVAALDRWGGDGAPVASRADIAATLGYLQNWHLLMGGSGYFEQSALPSTLQHTWSLSIEEQFYLLWPLLLGGVLLRTSAGRARPQPAPLRRALVVTLATAAASAALMAALYHPGDDPSRVYYGTDTRASALLLGAVLAIGLTLRADRLRLVRAGAAATGTGDPPRITAYRQAVLPEVLGWAGAGALAVLWTRASGDSPGLYRGGMLLGELGAALAIAAVVLHPRALLARVLSWGPLRRLGMVSYGVYLWHGPVLGFVTAARTGLHGSALLAVRLAGTLLVAVVSFVLVERPLRYGSLPRLSAVRRPALVATVLGVTAVVLPAGVAVALAPPSSVPTVALGEEQAQDDGTAGGDPEDVPSVPPTTPRRNRAAAGASSRNRDRSGEARDLLVMGDSVAKSLAAGLTSYLQGSPLHVTDGAVLGCGVTIGGPYHYSGQLRLQGHHCPPWESRWRARVKATDPDVVVLLVGRWEVMDRVFQGRWTHIGDPAYDAYLQGQLRKAIGILQSTGARVVVLTAPYYRRGEQPDGDLWPEDVPDRTDRWNALLRAAAAPAGASVVDFGHETGPRGRYEEVVDGTQLRYDGVHLREAGVRAVAPWLLPRLLGPLHVPKR
jgi:peptidoglycan/LPS O-acetylase OafA/YrhL/lysophospholipase L1-like esterase